MTASKVAEWALMVIAEEGAADLLVEVVVGWGAAEVGLTGAVGAGTELVMGAGGTTGPEPEQPERIEDDRSAYHFLVNSQSSHA
jgi:hypothetical protein